MAFDTRSHVHALIDRLPPLQLAALETLLKSLIDPVARAAAMLRPMTNRSPKRIGGASTKVKLGSPAAAKAFQWKMCWPSLD